jgi:hypothetical protein
MAQQSFPSHSPQTATYSSLQRPEKNALLLLLDLFSLLAAQTGGQETPFQTSPSAHRSAGQSPSRALPAGQ